MNTCGSVDVLGLAVEWEVWLTKSKVTRVNLLLPFHIKNWLYAYPSFVELRRCGQDYGSHWWIECIRGEYNAYRTSPKHKPRGRHIYLRDMPPSTLWGRDWSLSVTISRILRKGVRGMCPSRIQWPQTLKRFRKGFNAPRCAWRTTSTHPWSIALYAEFVFRKSTEKAPRPRTWVKRFES